jgi:ankyrin repeat protein
MELIQNPKIPVGIFRDYIQDNKDNLNYYGFQYTALTTAIAEKRNDIVRLLLDTPGVDINKPSRVNRSTDFQPLSADRTPLMFAIQVGNLEAFNMLLDCKGIDVNYRDIYGQTALTRAYEIALDETVADEAVMKQNQDSDYMKLNTLWLNGILSDKELIRAKLFVNPFFKRLYHYPGVHKSLSYVNKYVNDEENDNMITEPCSYYSYDDTPYPFIGGEELYRAVQSNNHAIAERLFQEEAESTFLLDVNYLHRGASNWSESVLWKAVAEQNAPIVRRLLSHPRIDINLGLWGVETTDWNRQVDTRYPRDSPFHTACGTGNLQIVNLFLAHPNINVNIMDTMNRKTPLMYAAEGGYYAVVQRLLEEPTIDVNHSVGRWRNSHPVNECGHAAYIAIINGNPNIARLILNHPRAAPHMYRSVLPAASALGNHDTVELCLDLGKRDMKRKFCHAKRMAFFACIEAVALLQQEIAELLFEVQAYHTHYYKNKLQELFVKKIHEFTPSMLEWLLTKANVDINLESGSKDFHKHTTPLIQVIVNRRTDLLLILLNHPNMKDTQSIALLPSAIEKNNVAAKFSKDIHTAVQELVTRSLYTEESIHDSFFQFISETEPGRFFSDWHIRIMKVISDTPGFDINRLNNTSETALMIATKLKRLEIMRFLFKIPTLDIEITNSDGKTAYYMAKDDAEELFQEYIYYKRECRALTEISIFGKHRGLPVDILRVIGKCLKGMNVYSAERDNIMPPVPIPRRMSAIIAERRLLEAEGEDAESDEESELESVEED